MQMKRLIPVSAAAIVLTAAALAQTLPQGVQKVTSVEGITEYAFPNGLRVLLFPDNSKPKITVNVVYLVGSRNEGYGETGMAHLLEHMVFKTAKSGRELFKELTDRTGGNFNGTTNYDQTMYFETLNSGDDNLRWALGLEADRMVNMTMKGVRGKQPHERARRARSGRGLQLPQLREDRHRQPHRRGARSHRQPRRVLPEVFDGHSRRHPQTGAHPHAALYFGAHPGR
jgi:hypothetical protein